MSPSPPKSKRTSHIFTIVTLVVSVACLAWAVHGVSWTELWEEIRELDWRWVPSAPSPTSWSMSFKAGAGACCCSPLRRCIAWASVGAIYVGLFANEVLPLRAGEVIRCF
jgi:uncharacterized membrane protein YbhN (UPF0104 family)